MINAASEPELSPSKWGSSAQSHSLSVMKITFGGELYRLRNLKQLTQADIGTRANVARGYYSQIENSKRFPPPPETLVRIAIALGLNSKEMHRLQWLANAERCGMVHLPDEMPVLVANLVKKLTASAHQISAEKIQQMEALLVKDLNM